MNRVLSAVLRVWRDPVGRAMIVLGFVLAAIAVFLVTAERPADAIAAAAERAEAGKNPLYKHDVIIGLYRAALVNAGLVIVLIVTARWWARPLAPPDAVPEIASCGLGAPRLSRRPFTVVLLGFVLLGGVLRWEFAGGGLWWDEMWNVRQTIVGKYRFDDEGKRGAFEEATLDRAIWYYPKPTNHAPASLLSNISVKAWRAFSGGNVAPHQVPERAVRFPMFFCSVLSIAGLGFLLRSWGFPMAGLAAAGILALHPWQVRYGIDARAYSQVILLVLGACGALTAMCRSRRDAWWPWLVFGLCQFLLIWSFLASLWLVGFLSVAAAGLVFLRWRSWPDRVRGWLRLGVVSVGAAMAFAQVFAPNLIQMRRFFEALMAGDRHVLTWALTRDALTKTGTGMPWTVEAGPAGEGLASLKGVLEASPMLTGVLILVSAGLLAAGVRVAMGRPRLALLLASIVGGGVAYLGIVHVTGQYVYDRFVIYWTLPFAALLGLGASRFARGRWGTLGVVVIFGLLVLPQLRVLWERPYAPNRALAEFVKAEHAKSGDGLIVAGYGLGGGDVFQVYWPEARFPVSRADVEALMREADESGAGLLLYYGYAGFNRATHADGFALIDDPALFEEEAAFRGIEPDFFFHVLRYRGRGRG